MAGTFDALARVIRGRVIEPRSSEYDSARRVWNGMIDRRPRAIVRCTEAADVVAAVQFAAAEGLLVAVRGGGHNVAGNGVCDDGLVIDLGGMKRIRIDPVARRAHVEGGVLWGELDAATQEHGLATTGGLVPSTGVSGFTLGGGLGYLMRSHALACDNLVSAEVVTAHGAVVHASTGADEDLLWGLRGGGGNFGVVTSFTFDLHPIEPDVPVAVAAHPLVGGAVARVPRAATAFEHRDAMYSVLILAGWERPDETSACVAWARELWERTRRFSTGGVYVNYLGTEGEDRVRQAYGANHTRLAALKARYDPTNFFRLNQNIAPART